MTWYVTGEPCYASVPSFRVHDLGGAEWSVNPIIVFPFGRVPTPPSLCGHLALTVTFVRHVARLRGLVSEAEFVCMGSRPSSPWDGKVAFGLKDSASLAVTYLARVSPFVE